MAHLQQGRLLVVLVLFLVNHLFASHGSPLSLTHYTACATRPAHQSTKVPQSFCSVRSSPRHLNTAALAQTIRMPGSEQDSSSSSRHMAHQPRSVVVLLVLFLAIHVSSASPLSPTHYNQSMCSVSFECGGVNITYPFFLSSATEAAGDYTSYSCGYTDLKIFCDGEGETKAPILQLSSYTYKYNYTILDIFYDNRTIVVADTELLAGSKCPTVLGHNVTFGDKWLSYAGDSSVHSLTFFSDCDPAPPETEKYQINCTEFSDPPGPAGSRGRVSFVFSSKENVLPQEYRLAERCRDIVVVPVRADALVAGDDQDTLRWEYGAMVQRGFELVWRQSTVPQEPCYLCEQSGGRCAYSDKTEFVGCLCSGGKVGPQGCHRPASRVAHSKKIIYIVAGILSTLLLCLLSLISYKKYGFRRKSKETSTIESFLQKNGTIHPKRYTYAQVKRMTKSFAEKLGQGGFGAVYRGDLADGRQIAVKMLKDYKTDGEDFINEVASISRTSHVNIVTLSGFCLQGSKRALIYDYMPNGSLERYAFKDNSKAENALSWEKLFDIAVGIARGLEYLHRGCNTRIVHFDIKPHNILLDQDFCPKISDFGLAKLCLNKESAISIGGARGTIGYIAPEVYSKQFGTVSSKSDVYSYGMMVLEMVGARDKNINANSESSSQYFPQWIYEHLDAYCVSASEINGEITEIVRKMIVIGLWCIQLRAANRPTMTRVVEMLEGSTSDLELPPKVLLI